MAHKWVCWCNLTNLKKLAGLTGGISKQGFTCMFVAGLPDYIKQLLHMSRMEEMTQLLDWAWTIMKDQIATVETAAASTLPVKAIASKLPNAKCHNSIRCYQCTRLNNFSKNCLVQWVETSALHPPKTIATVQCFLSCWLGHIDSDCLGTDKGNKISMPVFSTSELSWIESRW